jgi:hypothetical protein
MARILRRLHLISIKARVEDLSLDGGLAATTAADVDERARFLTLHPDKPPHRGLQLALMHLAVAQETSIASNLCSLRDFAISPTRSLANAAPHCGALACFARAWACLWVSGQAAGSSRRWRRSGAVAASPLAGS